MTDLGIHLQPITHGSKTDLYLRSRGIRLKQFPKDLCMDDKQNMVAIIRDKSGEAISYQRTFLTLNSDGSFSKFRMMKKGVRIPHGSSIRLAGASKVMGVAESTEDALSAMFVNRIPVWSAVTAGGLEKFSIPRGVEDLYIYGDNDENGRGQVAANRLALRAEHMGVTPHVRILQYHKDYNDFVMEKPKCASQMTPREAVEPELVRGYSL